jgi:mono/diheme cytochrome c family protein
MVVMVSLLASLKLTEGSEVTVEQAARSNGGRTEYAASGSRVAGAYVEGRAILARPQSSLTPEGARTVWGGVFTQAQADRGGAVYSQNCANCHGSGLEGADMSPALAGAAFMASWNDLTLGDLSERIRISMPADRPGTLSRQEQADVIAFILRSNRFPAGTSELPTETPALRAVKFLTVQP